MNPYVKAVRLPFLAGSVIPVIIGATFAFEQGCFSFGFFLLSVSGITGLHLGANLLNDYFDARGSDPLNVRITPFSGGSRVIQDGKITARTVLVMALLFFGVGLGTGIWFALAGRPLAIPIGVLGLGIGWAYSAPPLRLMNRGWGEAVIFFAFGPLITLGTFYVMSGSLNWAAFMLGAPQGFFISAVIWINQFPDYEADKQAGKRNLGRPIWSRNGKDFLSVDRDNRFPFSYFHHTGISIHLSDDALVCRPSIGPESDGHTLETIPFLRQIDTSSGLDYPDVDRTWLVSFPWAVFRPLEYPPIVRPHIQE